MTTTATQQAAAVERHGLTGRPLLALAAGIALLEGYDLACYGVTVISLLADTRLENSPSHAGTIGSLVAIGTPVGAAA